MALICGSGSMALVGSEWKEVTSLGPAAPPLVPGHHTLPTSPSSSTPRTGPQLCPLCWSPGRSSVGWGRRAPWGRLDQAGLLSHRQRLSPSSHLSPGFSGDLRGREEGPGPPHPPTDPPPARDDKRPGHSPLPGTRTSHAQKTVKGFPPPQRTKSKQEQRREAEEIESCSLPGPRLPWRRGDPHRQGVLTSGFLQRLSPLEDRK